MKAKIIRFNSESDKELLQNYKEMATQEGVSASELMITALIFFRASWEPIQVKRKGWKTLKINKSKN